MSTLSILLCIGVLPLLVTGSYHGESGSCVFFGRVFPSGKEIYRNQLQDAKYCSGILCLNSKIVISKKYNCSESITGLTGKPRQRESFLTPPPLKGCTLFGKFYRPGQTLHSRYTANGCIYALVCNTDGKIGTMIEPNRPTTTLPPPTPFTTPTPPTTVWPGCEYEGKRYQLGETISSGQSGNWCYVTICDYSGQVIHGDDFNCSPPTTPTTTATTDIPIVQVG